MLHKIANKMRKANKPEQPLAEPEAAEPRAAMDVPLFPVSFVVIARPEDWDAHRTKLLNTLPVGSEVNVLFNVPSNDGEEHVGEMHIEYAKEYTIRARMWEHTQFSFGRARTLADQMATQGWAMWLDCDDRLNPAQHGAIASIPEQYAETGGVAVVFVSCHSMHVPIPPNTEPEYSAVKQARIYRTGIGFQWEGDCHEQNYIPIQRLGYKHATSQIIVNHVGYAGSLADLKPRTLRNIQLLCHELSRDGIHTREGFALTMLHRDLNTLYSMEKGAS